MVKIGPSKTYFATLAAVMAGAILFYPQFWMSHDNSWYLIATRMFLEGKRLYVDIVEINPPLAFYLTAPALLLADTTGVNDTTAYQLWVISMSGVSCLLQWQVLKNTQLQPKERAIFLYTGMVGLFILPTSEFGQREHWLLIFALPYLYRLILLEDITDRQVKWSICIGVFASIGLCLKPHFLAIPAMLLLAGQFRMLPSRVFDPSNLSVGVCWLLYLAFIYGIHPEYLTDIVPTALQVYSTFGDSTFSVLKRRELTGLIALALLFFWGTAAKDKISIRLMFGVAGASICYLLQFKGWNYQIIPLSFFLMASAVWLIHRKQAFPTENPTQFLLAVIVLITSIGTQIQRGPMPDGAATQFVDYVDKPGERILVLSTNVSAAFPFVNMVDGVWTSRFPAQWQVPGAVIKLARTNCEGQPQVCNGLEQILADARSAMVQDFLKNEPEVVFVDDRQEKSYFDGLPFDYIEFMKEDPEFVEAWSQYGFVERVNEYTYWKRHKDTNLLDEREPTMRAAD